MQMPALRLPRPALQRPSSTTAKLHCELDDWWFDARYTDGACPICGWRPEGVTYSAPLWLRAARSADWELIGLVFMVLLLVVLGFFVERTAGLSPNDIGRFLSGA
jgi:hypothetical protein